MTSAAAALNDDLGGRVCMECQTPDDEYVATLFAYSSYTKRDSVHGDRLFFATQTSDGRAVTVMFHPVPYRLFLTPLDFKAIQQKGIEFLRFGMHSIRTCIRKMDSSCTIDQELIEVRFQSRYRYLEAYQQLVKRGVPLAIDGAHDVLHGLDAVLNHGIPGACATLRIKHWAGKLKQNGSQWNILVPSRVCAHGDPPQLPVLSTVMAMEWNAAEEKMCIAFSDVVEKYGVGQLKKFEDTLRKARPTVVLLHDIETTLRHVYRYVSSALFSFLFSLLSGCPPAPPGISGTFFPGLGVLVFEVATMHGMNPDEPLSRWVHLYRSQRWLEERWNLAIDLRSDMHNLSGAYGAFTAAMVLRYASNRTVCQLIPEARGSYQGGCTIPPRPGYLLDRPIAQFDFVSMYPSISCVINAGKDTFVSKGGHWQLGEFGGFSTFRRGCLADVLRKLLDERLCIVGDPSMKRRAAFLKKSMNAMVGMAGHKNNPYSDTRVSGCITAVGRHLLRACHLPVSDNTLAGYTDSLFLQLPCVPTNAAPLQTWMSKSVVKEHEARFQSIVRGALESMAPANKDGIEPLVQIQCKDIGIAGLFTGVAHTYAAGYLLPGDNGNPQVDIQVKGGLKFAPMECVRSFNEALICTAIAGEFLLVEKGASRLGDVRTLAAAVPISVMTSTGWKMALKVATSTGLQNTMEAVIQYNDNTEDHHWFLPQANADRLVDVTHVVRVEDVGSCLERRRLSALAITETFARQMFQGRLPLSTYVWDKKGEVMVRLEERPSQTVPLSEAARNGFSLDLERYRRRWIETCIDNLACGSCHRLLTNALECRYVPEQEHGQPLLVHESCSVTGAIPLDQVACSLLSRHIKTALSAILVAGAANALEAVSHLIGLQKLLMEIPARDEPPSRPYGEVLAQLRASVTNAASSTEYVCPPLAFACFPDGQGSWFHLPTEPTSLTSLGLLYEAMRILVRHGRYDSDSEVLEAISAYPAHRLRVAPPPVLKKGGKAPVPAWQQVMNELAESPERPKLVTTTTFHCQFCRAIFNLEIGVCGHLACKTCSIEWKTCSICKVEWHGLDFHGTPQMNYHPRVFPFEEWYEYLPITKWCVYCGPDELIYDSSAAHIIALARGKVCK